MENEERGKQNIKKVAFKRGLLRYWRCVMRLFISSSQGFTLRNVKRMNQRSSYSVRLRAIRGDGVEERI